MNYIYKHIELNSIDTEFTPFSFSYGFNISELVDSIQKVGLINPPILKKVKDGFVLVAGYKRILAVKELGWKKVWGLILSEDMPSFNCLLINFYDNISTRKLNEVEKAILISKLSNYIKPEQIIKDYFSLLDLPQHMPTYRFYIWIAKSLSNKVKDKLANGEISLKAIRIMYENEIPQEDIEIYADFMSKLKFNFNKQLQLIEYTQDICRKEKITLKQLFGEKEIVNIIESKTLTNPDKVKKILDIFRKRNFPELSRAEDIFKKRVQRLNLPAGVELKAPPYFESPYYRLEISFRNGNELKKKLIEIANIEGIEIVGDPWKQ